MLCKYTAVGQNASSVPSHPPVIQSN